MKMLKVVIAKIYQGVDKTIEFKIENTIEGRTIFVKSVLSQYSLNLEEIDSFVKGNLRPIIIFENDGLDDVIMNIDFIPY